MYKKIISLVLLWCSTAISMEMETPEPAETAIDDKIVTAITRQSPWLLRRALDARMKAIYSVFNDQADTLLADFNTQKRAINLGTKAKISEAQARQKAKVKMMPLEQLYENIDEIDDQDNQEIASLNAQHTQKHNELWRKYTADQQEIARNYQAAQENFKNKEVIAYLRKAQEIRTKICKTLMGQKPLRNTNMTAKGSVLLGCALLGTGYVLINMESTLAKSIVIPVCVLGCYVGGKKTFDGHYYEQFLKEQQKTNDIIQRILYNRQDKWFDRKEYTLKKF